ncbi:MAG: hypothetical protein OXC91_10180 [Rhodobacteraceae bacterium]|nr:hypothetical protein [Paracoccaceae bacterium]
MMRALIPCFLIWLLHCNPVMGETSSPRLPVAMHDVPFVTMISQSFRSMGLHMGRDQGLTRQDLLDSTEVHVGSVYHPEMPGGVNIASYAISTQHPVGEQRYDRSARIDRRDRIKCEAFENMDAIQQIFLNASGPEIDRHGIDPDGDGYACSWDPTPYRRFLYDSVMQDDESVMEIILTGPGHYEE